MCLVFASLMAVAVDGDTLRCPEAESDALRVEIAVLRADLDRINHRVQLAWIDPPVRGERLGSRRTGQGCQASRQGRHCR